MDICWTSKKDRQKSQNLNNDTSYRLLVTIAQCLISTEKYAVAGIILNYNEDELPQRHGQIKAAFRALTKNLNLPPYISDDDFGNCDDDVDVRKKLYVFVIRYQK